MKCLILCAGLGTRMGDLVKDIPKPMLEVGGTPILRQIIKRLNEVDIGDIIINLFYKPELIVNDFSGWALFFHEDKLLGHLGTIDRLRGFLEGGPFFVVNGDTLSNVNYKAMMDKQINGKILSLMDEEYRSLGTWLYPADYFNVECSILPYRQKDLVCHHIGTPEQLKTAREYYKT